MSKGSQSFRTSFIRSYHHFIHDVNRLGQAYGISGQEAKKILDDLARGVNPSPDKIEKLLENRANSEDLLSGPDSANEVHRREGPNYTMIDFEIGPGQTIPPELLDIANGFQAIIKGHDNHGDRKATTMIYGDLDSLSYGVTALMSSYGKFKGETIIIRVFIPND